MVKMRRNERRGANAIEFALTFPVFIMMLFGFVDFGAYFAGQGIADSITAQTCRNAALLDPFVEDVEMVAETQIQERVDTMPFLSCDSSACSIEVTIEGAPPSTHLVCRATLDTSSISGLTPVPEQIGSASMMRMEWQR